MSESSESRAWSLVLSQTERAGVCYTHQSFDSEAALGEFLLAAQRNKTAVIPGRPHRIPPSPAVSAFVSADLSGLQSVREHQVPDQVIGVETGIRLASLNEMLARHRQWWPVNSPSPEATIFDVINSGEGGCLEHMYGGARELVLGASVCLAGGTLIKCGGKVVKNVTGYDLLKLIVGSRGWLGLCTAAYLRLYALPESRASVCLGFSSAGELMQAWRELQHSGLPLSCLELVDSRLADKLGTKDGTVSAGIERVIAFARQKQFLLLLQVHGMKAAVEEVIALACAAAGAQESGLAISEPSQDEIWSALSATQPCPDYQTVEIACHPSLIEKILSRCRSFEETALWQCRPSRGRLKLYLPSELSIKPLIEKLRHFCLDNSESFSVAYASESYNYLYERLPSGDDVQAQLVRRLKDQLDPSGILNPLVSL